MKKSNRFFFIIFMASMSYLLCACSTPVRPIIELQPQAKVIPSSIGQGKTIALTMSDARPKNNESNARIDSTQNVSQIISNQLLQGFQKKGFNILQSNDVSASNQLNIQLSSLEYRALSGYVSSNIQTFASIKIMSKNSLGTYTKTYNASTYNDNYLSATQQSPSEQVNMTVNKLLDHILNDSGLLQFLSEK